MPTREGPYSKNTVKITQGAGRDKPFGSPRQLDIEKNYAEGRSKSDSWPPGGPSETTPNRTTYARSAGGSGKLPKDHR